jgi:TonB-dependent starch-binding outer membrane protein SusC
MWGRMNERGALLVALGIALGGAGCASAGSAYRPLPSGVPVAVGYAGVAGRGTGAVVDMSGDEMKATNATRIEHLLRRVPGVEVTRGRGERVMVRIRGQNTIIGSGEPLLVIDGIPVQYDTGGLLRDIHPNDIARIEVLKDAASTAIFGLRGGSGVIMITTRRTR